MIDARLSRVAFGTMRLGKAGGVDEAAALIDHARAIGVTSVHCSSEYDSFALFTDAWRACGSALDATVIAKVAAPHYGEDRFDVAAFRVKVEAYLSTLGIEQVVVQWLLRYDLKQEDARLRILHDGATEIAGVVAAMKAEGKIAGFVGFPYTMPIADVLADADWCDGLALYVNPLEHDTDVAIDACARAGKPVIAIRPYAAGRVFAETDMTAEAALEHVFAYAPVVTAVVSASSRAHLDALRPQLAA